MNLAYIAFVWENSSIHTKVAAQQRSLQRMRGEGSIGHLLVTECTTGSDGSDWISLGGSVLGRIQRGGVLRSAQNLLINYPKVFRRARRTIHEGKIDTVYIRKPPIFDAHSVRFMRSLRKSGVRVVLEIPTYPYDRELTPGSIQSRLDHHARRRLVQSVDLIATLSNDAYIFGVPCVHIDNCADVYPLASEGLSEPSLGIRATFVAALESWHRADRIISTLVTSWDQGDTRISRLNIVGDGPQSSVLERAAGKYANSETGVLFHGAKYGSELERIFGETDLGIGNLETVAERGLAMARPLKHREYAARGIPFIFGLDDPSFARSAYALRVPEEEIDLDRVVHWFDSLNMSASQIRDDATRFRWESQFERVLETLPSQN